MSANEFRRFRRLANYSQQKLALSLGCSQQHVCNIECERVKPSSEILTKMFALVVTEHIASKGLVLA